MRTVPTGENMIDVRLRNRGTLMSTLLTQAPISRSSLSRVTGLNPGTVTNIVRELIDENLVCETDTVQPMARSRPGPREVMLDLHQSGAFAIGVQIGRETLAVALVDLRGEIGAEAWLDDHRHMGGSDMIAWVVEQAVGLMARTGITRAQLVGVGVAVAGIADPFAPARAQEIERAWQDGALAGPLEEALGVPVLVDNHVRAAAIGETWFGAGRDVSDLLLVWVANVVGCGIVINGRVHQGHRFAAGQIGHTRMDPNGPPCRCGKRGCLQTRISEHAVAHRGAELAVPGSLLFRLVDGEPEKMTAEVVVAAARLGDESALGVFHQVATELGVVVAELVALFDPQRVVVAGPMVTALGPLFLGPLRESMHSCLTPNQAADMEIVTTRFGRSVGLVGAASLALRDRVFAPNGRTPSGFTRRIEALANRR